MAPSRAEKPCTIVFHDDRVSEDDVLCSTDLLPEGSIGVLKAKDAKSICVSSNGKPPGPREVSLHVSLGERFGFENRMPATITVTQEPDSSTANHVEFFFRDICLSRADMWQMTRFLDGKVIYKDQEIRYLGAQTAVARRIFIDGQEANSALVRQPKTKPIFRSGSAKFTLMIQLSHEMLTSWRCGNLMYENMIEGYLTELFQRWERMKLRHHFSMVLFGKLARTMHSGNSSAKQSYGHDDFYKVVCEDESSADWQEAIRSLKLLFNSPSWPQHLTQAAQGNMLEAIHLGALDVVDDSIDPRLSSTGRSIIAITAGTGFFDSEHGLLKRTTDLLLGNSIGVDIVALSPKPLHPVPLFKYTLGSSVEYALPHWADISYWRPSDYSDRQSDSHWLLPQADLEVRDVAIDNMICPKNAPAFSSLVSAMDELDAELVREPSQKSRPPNPAQRYAPESTSVESTRTLKGKRLAPANEPAVQHGSYNITAQPPKVARNPSISSSLMTRTSNSTHPLLQAGRKISIGARGLAPVTSLASTTISTEHASHGKEVSSSAFTPNEASSGLAKQIRASLARKRSQQSLLSTAESTSDAGAKPIDIHGRLSTSSHEQSEISEDTSSVEVSYEDLSTVKEESPQLSRTPKPFPSVGSLPELEAKELEQQALTPWLTLCNPCNPRRDNMRIANQYRKWHHAYPKAVESAAFKWDSMCTPASLPLTTDLVPSARELDKHYERKLRRLVLSGFSDEVGQASKLMHRLIFLRLARGYQLIARPTKSGPTNMVSLEQSVLLSRGTLYQEIEAVSDLELQVIEYSPNARDDLRPQQESMTKMVYGPRMASSTTSPVRRSSIDMSRFAGLLDWATVDRAVVDDANDTAAVTFTKMRLVLLPVDMSTKDESGNATIRSRDLSDEEKRIDGIQKLTQLWQKHRVAFSLDQGYHASLAKHKPSGTAAARDPNPLAIDYRSQDPSVVVNAQDTSLARQSIDTDTSVPLFAESEKYHSSDFDLTKLIKQMQEPPPLGVEVRDRRWFTRLHLNCFRGDEMTNWLLGVFKDLDTREDAITLGNQLMDRGIFTHVRHKHAFRDGHYFYQIASGHRTTEYPDTASFFTKSAGKSVPPTPILESIRSPSSRPVPSDSESSGRLTPSNAPQERKQILLSQVLSFNIDPSSTSSHAEVVSLHYDRIHNPDNCYHIRIDWLNATPKLLREALARWTSLVEGYGLRLVQLPVAEASKQHLHHPFDRPQPVHLISLPPDNVPITPYLNAHSALPRSKEDPAYYHKAVLRKSGFILDLEAASSFSSKLDVTYSWGRPDYEMTQFVHKSGLVLAQISVEGDYDFLLLPNRLAPLRGGTGRTVETLSPEDIIKTFRTFCQDEKALKSVFEEAKKPKAPAPSPFANSALALSDIDVPPMQLPPHLLQRGHG